MAISSKTSASLSGGISQLLSQSHAPFPRETGAAAAELCRERDGREKKSEEGGGSAQRTTALRPRPAAIFCCARVRLCTAHLVLRHLRDLRARHRCRLPRRSARFGHSAPATSTSQKKKVKRLPALPRHKTFPKHLEIPKIDSASTKQQQSGKTGREEERRADAGDVRPVTKTHCCLSRRGHRARARHPPLDGGGRRGPRGRTSLALFLLLEDKAPKVASCGLPTRVWGQLTGLF